ncbi:MAG TPA: prepilin peptidase [Solirubrobacterales bacterium]|jgi:leader peptidase (prepilin peptidase)/N-methyltransferase|nr:prepilin peptidase [Solirubrobacterales bacterium]
MTAIAPIAFVGGMLFGSFASVIAHRVPRGEAFVAGRSHCPGCGATIAGYDNVPVISWLLLRGRCRSCGEAISPRYPLAELAMAVLFAATVLVLGTDDVWSLVLGLVFCALLVTVTLTDLDRRVIPNAILGAGALAAVAILAVGDPSSVPQHLLAAAGAGGFLLAAALAYPKGMGMGDVKLAAVMGLFLGRAVVPALAVAILAGALVGAAILLRHGSEARKRAIPFGPFLALGGVVGLLAGDEILDWYLDSFVG